MNMNIVDRQSNQRAHSEHSEIAVIDTSVEGHEALASSLGPEVELIYIDRNSSGIEQIADALEGRDDIDALHIVSHGAEGLLALGSDRLTGDTLSDHAVSLAAIGDALDEDGDILLYGCEVASGDGVAFITDLSEITGADVAASDDLTGAADQGGDWDFELVQGSVETDVVFSEKARADFTNVLAFNGTVTFASAANFSNDSSYGAAAQNATYAVGAYTLVLDGAVESTFSSGASDPARRAGGGSLYGNETSITLSFSGGETFDVSSINLANIYFGSVAFTVTSSNGETATTGSLSTSASEIVDLSGFSTGLTSIVITKTGGGTFKTMTMDDLVLANVGGSSDPEITSSTYNANTGVLTVTGSNFTATAGAVNDVDVSDLTITGEGGDTHQLTNTADVEITSPTEFSVTLAAADKAAVNLILNKDGASSADSTTYNLAGAAGFIADAGAVADLTGNGITVSAVPDATITSATYDVTTGALVVTGTGFTKSDGVTNDVDVSDLTITGEGSGTRALTVSDVEISSGTEFTLILTGADKTAVDAILNKNGTTSLDNTTYNLAGAAGFITANGGADLTLNGITVSNANEAPTITGAPSDITTLTEETQGNIDLSAVTVGDADGDSLTVTLTASAGTFATPVDGAGVTETLVSPTQITLVGTAANINTYLDTASNIKYTGATDASGNDAATITISASDGNGGSFASNPVVNLDITNVNDDPTVSGIPSDIPLTEDTQGNIGLATASFADVDGDTITVTLTASAGTFATPADGAGNSVTETLVSSTVITLVGTAANINTYLDTTSNIQYTPASNVNGNDAATITVTANDGAGSGNVTLGTINLDITAVNDRPTVTGAPSDITLTEDTSGNIDLSAVSVADVENSSLTITLTASEGTFGTPADGSGVGGGVTETRVSNTEITLTGAAADINAYLDTASNITYTGSSNDSGNDTATITISGSDGAIGFASDPVVNLDITEVNDEPTLTATGDNSTAAGAGSAVSVFSSTAINAIEAGQAINTITFTVSGLVDTGEEDLILDGATFDLMTDATDQDAAGGNIRYTIDYDDAGTSTITLTGNGGTGAAGSVFVTALNAMQYQNTLGAVTAGNRVFTITSMTDAGGTANSGDDTVALNVVSTIDVVNGDTPTATSATKAATEDTPFTMTASEIVTAQEANASDALEYITIGTITGGALALTGSPAAGTATDSSVLSGAGALTSGDKVNITDLTLIQFTPDANRTTDASLTYTVTDAGGDTSAAATLTITLAAVNDIPTITGAPTDIALTEDTSGNIDLSGVTVADVEGSTLTITLTASEGTFGTPADGASVGGGVTETRVSNTVITLDGAAADINSYLDTASNITYTGSQDDNGNDTATITISGSDGTAGFASDPVVNLDITGENDAPELDLDANDSVTVGTGFADTLALNDADGELYATDVDVSVSDPDNVNLSTVTMTLSGVVETAQESIVLTSAPGVTVANGVTLAGGIVVTYTSATEISLDVSSATHAQVQNAVNLLTYIHSGSATDKTTGERSISVVANDGTVNSAAVTSTITVTGVPQVTSATYDEDTKELTVTGRNFAALAGADNDVDVTKLTLTGEGGGTRALTAQTSNVEITSATSFTITIGGTDVDAVDALLNKDGISSSDSTTYNLALADDFLAGYTAEDTSDATVAVTVSGITVPTPPAPTPTETETETTETIDGVTVQTTTTTNDDGTTTTVRTIAPVTSDREEDGNTANEELADIPLQFADGGGTVSQTTASLPVGIGAEVSGSATPSAVTRDEETGDVLHDLLTLTNAAVDAADAAKESMLSGGRSFLSGLVNEGKSLVVNSLVLTAANDLTSAPENPVTISGSTEGENSGVSEALVIDASALPPGTVLNLENIEFAVIIGPATLRGGTGPNVLYAGAGSQFIVLGEDDDILHGGDGDDTVGSEGGDDQLFGNAGNDTLFGGAGADQLHGGADTDTVTYTGNRDDYRIEQVDSVVTVTLLSDETDVDTLINVENIQFVDQTLSVSYGDELELLATLYNQVLGRQADLGGIQFWAGASAGDATVSAATAFNMLTTAEVTSRLGRDLADQTGSDAVTFLYEAVLGRTADSDGLAYWTGILDAGGAIGDIAVAFAASAELSGVRVDSDQWEFIV